MLQNEQNRQSAIVTRSLVFISLFSLALFFRTFLSLVYYRMSVKYVYFAAVAAAAACPFGLFQCSLIHKYTLNVNGAVLQLSFVCTLSFTMYENNNQ